MRNPNRLDTLEALTCSVLVAFVVACGNESEPSGVGAGPMLAPIANPIVAENRLAGSDAWEVTQHVTAHELEAYVSAASVTGGESLAVQVSTSVASSVGWQLFRLGYYGGHGARLVARDDGVRVEPQPECPPSDSTGLVECHWASAFRISIDPEWLSGYYLLKLTRADGFETTTPFVVRESTPRAPVLVQASTNTWQAYNRWGGTSLYHLAQQVSYDRPYGTHDGAGRMVELEIWLVHWLEARGIDVAYTTDIDVDRDPGDLERRRLFVVSGHDEYWTLGERDAVEAARDAGVSLAFLSANTGYWRVRLEPSSAGDDRRIITCYKSSDGDPERHKPDATVRFRDPPYARPENQLTGLLYQLGDYPTATLPLYVADESSWLFDGTALKNGDRVGVGLGGEWDEPADDENEPAGVDFVLSSPALDTAGQITTAAAALYEPTDHSFVFSAGTEEFAFALSEPHYADPRAGRMLENLVVHAGVEVPEPDRSPLSPTPNTLVPGQVSVLAGRDKAGHRDGRASSAELDSPSGLALGPDGTLYVTESGNHDVRAIDPSGNVTTLAGCGTFGRRAGSFADGHAKDACFHAPNGIAVGPDGVVYVADTGNHRIRAISNGEVSTFAGGSKGDRDGSRHHAQFESPFGLALGPDGSLFVVEPAAGSLRRIDPKGEVSTLTTNVPGATAVAAAPNGAVYVASPSTGRLYEWHGDELRTLTDADGTPGDRVAGPDVHSPLDAWLRPSHGLTVDGDRLVFSDMANDAIRVLLLGETSEFFGLDTLVRPTAPDSTLDNGEAAGLMLPRGIVPYRDGYAVADTGHHRIVLVRSVTAAAAK